MALDLRDLEVFLAVVRNGSFGPRGRGADRDPACGERAHPSSRARRWHRGVRAHGSRRGPDRRRRQLLPYAERCTALATEAVESIREGDHFPRFVVAVHSTFAHRVVPWCSARSRRCRGASPCETRTRTRSKHSCSTASPTSGFAIPSTGSTRTPRRVPLPTRSGRQLRRPGSSLSRRRRPRARRSGHDAPRRSTPGATAPTPSSGGCRPAAWPTGGSGTAAMARPRWHWRAITDTSRSSRPRARPPI